MRDIGALGVALLMLGLGIHYSRQVIRRQIEPKLATWMLFSLSTALSLLTYFASGTWDAVIAIGNLADVIMTTSVTMVIVAVRGRKVAFTPIDTKCFVAAAVITALWASTNQHELAHFSIQVLMVVAYAPTVKGLWLAKRNPEPYTIWVVGGLAMALAFAVALTGQSYLPAIYSARGFILSALVVALMIRLDLRSRKT